MLIKHKSFLICKCLYFELQKPFDFNVFYEFAKFEYTSECKISSIHSDFLDVPYPLLGYFYRVLITNIYKYSLFTKNICNFTRNAKKLHHELEKHKHIESI